MAVKEGGRAYYSRGQCPVTQLSIEVRERTSIQKKKERREEGGGWVGGEEQEEKVRAASPSVSVCL